MQALVPVEKLKEIADGLLKAEKFSDAHGVFMKSKDQWVVLDNLKPPPPTWIMALGGDNVTLLSESQYFWTAPLFLFELLS